MTNIIVLLITIFDNKNTCYSYYISRTKNLENVENDVSNMDLMVSGFTQLFKTTEKNTDQSSSEIKICPIKNQNIFANIKKKV